jgi:hypothetical protein
MTAEALGRGCRWLAKRRSHGMSCKDTQRNIRRWTGDWWAEGQSDPSSERFQSDSGGLAQGFFYSLNGTMKTPPILLFARFHSTRLGLLLEGEKSAEIIKIVIALYEPLAHRSCLRRCGDAEIRCGQTKHKHPTRVLSQQDA